MAGVNLSDITKTFGKVRAVDGISLRCAPGEFVALLGPSGCGKTTLLRLLAGFERADRGTIDIGDERVSDAAIHVPPERRRIGMVFQSYALWPHMTVAENVGYPLKVQGRPRRERQAAVVAALAAVGLDALAARRPSELSGGQRQRVALARCLAMQPRLVLLDEPLANLDVHLRDSMQEEFRAFHRRTGATMVYVTHDQAEAMALADRVAVMDRGTVQQIATPAELYREPATRMVAEFVGRGMVVGAEIETPLGDGRCRARLWGSAALLRCNGLREGGRREVCLRPEGLRLVDPGQGIGAEVRRTVFHGAATAVHVTPTAAPGTTLYLNVGGTPPKVGERVGIAVEDGWVIP